MGAGRRSLNTTEKQGDEMFKTVKKYIHDVNNNLTVVTGNIDYVLGTCKLTEEEKECLKKARTAAMNIAKITASN